jgi:hypothetical protein
MQDEVSRFGLNGEIKIMAIDSTKDGNERLEARLTSSAFISELHESPINNIEAARCAEMLRENERMVERIKAQAMDVADNVCKSLFGMPRHVQDNFIASIEHYSDKHDLVYARVRDNYERKYS